MVPRVLALALAGILPAARAAIRMDAADCEVEHAPLIGASVESSDDVASATSSASSLSDDDGTGSGVQQDCLRSQHCIRIGDTPCYEGSKKYPGAAAHWKELREFWHVSDDWLQGGLEQTDIGKVGKSGKLFKKNKDGHFIVKGMSKVDRYSMLEHLEEYSAYMKDKNNKDSLLPRFFTVCKVHSNKYKDLKSGVLRSQAYVVMWNWDRGNVDKQSPSLLFDLKGTTENRTVAIPTDKKPTEWPIFKDLNFGEPGFPDKVYTNMQGRVIETLRKDTQKLADWNLMDYSLVLRVEMIPVPEAKFMEKFCAGSVMLYEPILYGPYFATRGGYMVGQHACPEKGSIPGEIRDRPWRCKAGEMVLSVYTFGLVDVLQPWNMMKKSAQLIKRVGGIKDIDRDTVEPSYYQRRFMVMIERIFNSQQAPIKDPCQA